MNKKNLLLASLIGVVAMVTTTTVAFNAGKQSGIDSCQATIESQNDEIDRLNDCVLERDWKIVDLRSNYDEIIDELTDFYEGRSNSLTWEKKGENYRLIELFRKESGNGYTYRDPLY